MTAKLYIMPPDAAPSPDQYCEVASGPEVDGIIAVIRTLAGEPDRLIARIGATGLSSCEREFLKHLVRTYKAPSRPKPGRPETPEQKLGIASTFIMFSAWGKLPHKRALGDTAEHHGCSKSSVEKALTFARRYEDGRWWADRCKLAAKGKPWPEIIAE